MHNVEDIEDRYRVARAYKTRQKPFSTHTKKKEKRDTKDTSIRVIKSSEGQRLRHLPYETRTTVRKNKGVLS